MNSDIATIKTLVPNRGFGFVTTPNGDAFLHARALDSGVFDTLQVGDKLRAVIGQDELGRLRVTHAERL